MPVVNFDPENNCFFEAHNLKLHRYDVLVLAVGLSVHSGLAKFTRSPDALVSNERLFYSENISYLLALN